MIGMYVIDRNFICVASDSDAGGWCCFGMVVPGHDHEAEAVDVPKRGTRIDKALACAMFPDLDADKWDNGYSRDRKAVQ